MVGLMTTLRECANTGFVAVGNFGSSERKDYTIIGNAVNLTARLQSHAEIDGIMLGH
jgi:adenylate cyclase